MCKATPARLHSTASGNVMDSAPWAVSLARDGVWDKETLEMDGAPVGSALRNWRHSWELNRRAASC